jgi:hypothetical protein
MHYAELPGHISIMRDTSIRTYRAKHDFIVTPEPTPQPHNARSGRQASRRSSRGPSARLHEFEGAIPEDQYGAGTVEIWDRGTCTREGDAEEGLKFELKGRRLTAGAPTAT